jgi:outer membrane protein TolC
VAGGFDLSIERRLIVSIISLATLPLRTEIARDRFRAAQFRATEATLRLAAETRRQYYRAVAANQQVGFLVQAKASTGALSELALRLGESGALNKLDQAREHALNAETEAQLARARLQQRIERERLIRQMGLWGADIEFKLPASLPALPPRTRTTREVETEALSRRVDLQVAKLELEALAKSLGLTQATRFTNDLELAGISSYERTETDRTNKSGVEVGFEIPIFDFGQARTVDAEQRYMQAANRLAQRAVNIRSEAREAYQAYRGTYDITRFYQTQLIPLRQVIQDQSNLQFSGMLADVTTLITDIRARILSNAQGIDARRDFWIAHTDLHASLAGGGSGTGSSTTFSASTGAAGGGD